MVERVGALGARAPVAVELLPPATRFVFRGPVEAARACGSAFGCALPLAMNRAEAEGDRAALMLGPDEWLLLAEEGVGAALAGALRDGLGDAAHALVHVSHRQAGLVVAGASAATLLNAGCPLDLDPRAFPVGMATRTVLAKADITLWRTAPARWRLEVARSFAPYVLQFLKAAEGGVE